MEIGSAAQPATAVGNGSGGAAGVGTALEPTLYFDADVAESELVEAVQRGLRTTGYRCGPLSEREAALGWLAKRVRADLAVGAASP